MRDENGFKMHVQSESHVRQMVVVGENSTKFIQDYSNQFQRDFLQLLRTAHGEKKVNANHFYQEYIANKEHVHMNATRWTTLTEFVKQLGREGICRVEEGDRGLEVAWVDNSPEALRRQDAIRKKERQDKGDEEREQRMIQEQVERARRDAKDQVDAADEQLRKLDRDGAEKIRLNFTTKALAEPKMPPIKQETAPEDNTQLQPPQEDVADDITRNESEAQENGAGESSTPERGAVTAALPPAKFGISVGGPSRKGGNVFAAMKKNPLASSKSLATLAPQRPISEAERIMKEEMARKVAREQSGPPRKRHKVDGV